MSLGNADLFHPVLQGDGGDGAEWPEATFSGDFYREPDDVTRGLTLLSPGEDFGGFGLPGYSGLEGNFFDPKHQFQQTGSSATFKEGDTPPCTPPDPLFKFEVTTIYAAHMDQQVFQIGNMLLEFFEQQVASDITKVNPKKYAIKADCFLGSMMFSTKARVYTRAPGQYAIEFQRRAGDTVSFNRAFQMASEYFNSRVSVVPVFAQPPSLQNFAPPPLPGGPMPVSTEDLTPIIDMASMPGLQAEAVVSLAELAAEGSASLCDTRVFEIIPWLLQAKSMEVGFPTSRLLFHLAQRAEAAPLFMAHGIVPHMRAKTEDPATQAKVREQLNQALSFL